jgi:UDP-hydrolysing UDP-N-acetyl-D-glucosamine 2-epimerase
MRKKKVAIVTGSRSEFGILYWLIKELQESQDMECYTIATGSHLASSQGMTVNEIESSDIRIYSRIPMLMDGDDKEQTAYSVGLGVIGFTRELSRLSPDMIIILGDRFEILSVAVAASMLQIPIAHIGGGETDWANCSDGNIRNAITKLAHIHFVSTELYKNRILGMGEESWRVFNVGLPSLDHIKEGLMTKEQLEKNLRIKFNRYVFLITYLPVGLREEASVRELGCLLKALEFFRNEASIIFTLANADALGRSINATIQEFSRDKENIHVFQSLGKKRYLSMINISDVVIGNSSSGIIEAPSFQKPTVNIGIRQAGRIHMESIINVNGDESEIKRAIDTALYDDEFRKTLQHVNNVFGDGNSSKNIVDVIRKLVLNEKLLEKKLCIYGDGVYEKQ